MLRPASGPGRSPSRPLRVIFAIRPIFLSMLRSRVYTLLRFHTWVPFVIGVIDAITDAEP